MADQIPDLEEPLVVPHRKPWWSRALLGVLTLGIAGATVIHLVTTFLVNSPTNTVTDRYSPQINAWIYPWFDQNWRLFAPNPLSENITIEARVSATCGQKTTPWYDLTAMDYQAILHDPFPSHADQNELRRAWLDGYLPSHGTDDEPLDNRSEMLRQYLVNIALERIRPLSAKDGLPPAAIAEIEFRVTTQKISDAAAQEASQPADVRVVPWRQISPDIISYGCGTGGTP